MTSPDPLGHLDPPGPGAGSEASSEDMESHMVSTGEWVAFGEWASAARTPLRQVADVHLQCGDGIIAERRSRKNVITERCVCVRMFFVRENLGVFGAIGTGRFGSGEGLADCLFVMRL